MIEVELVKALGDFASTLPISVQLGGAAETARLKLVDATGAWLKVAGNV